MTPTSRFISSTFPYLPLTLTAQGSSTDILALIDTGFTGYLIVPRDFFAPGIRPERSVRWYLADDSYVYAPLHTGSLQLGGFSTFPVAIVALGKEFLVGRRVIDRFMLMLDHGQRVIVDP